MKFLHLLYIYNNDVFIIAWYKSNLLEDVIDKTKANSNGVTGKSKQSNSTTKFFCCLVILYIQSTELVWILEFK